jgi:ribosomal protein S16
MKFAGLPPTCPPQSHETHQIGPVYRILVGAVPEENDWKSHERLGKVRPVKVDPCRWASLSLQRQIWVAASLPNFKDRTHAAELDIPAGIGAHVTKKDHVDFWCSEGRCVSQFVKRIIEIRR